MTVFDTVAHVLAAVALLSGGLLAVVAGLGLLRLPDVASRLQAATKPQTLGLVLVSAGVAPFLEGAGVWALALVVLFQFATAPISAQLAGRAAYRSLRAVLPLVVDELRERERGG